MKVAVIAKSFYKAALLASLQHNPFHRLPQEGVFIILTCYILNMITEMDYKQHLMKQKFKGRLCALDKHAL